MLADPDPYAEIPADAADKVLILLPLPQAILCKLCWIADLLLGRLEILLLKLLGLTQNLLCCDLYHTSARVSKS